MAAEQQSGDPASAAWWPASWPDRIRALANGELEPVPPKRAATVILLRDSVTGRSEGSADAEPNGSGPAVYLLRRRASMAFAAGAYAYPGGSVDPRDEHAGLRWAGPGPEWWGRRLGCEPAVAQAVVCAAVRETFEESGVLLAGPDEGSVVADTTGEEWEADRTALVGHRAALAEVLARRGLVLRSDLLGAWARWVTPEFEERRYDTFFFVCLVPDGQRPLDVSGEADRTAWMRPGEAVARYDSGELAMLPPTVATLRSLAAHRTAADALAAAGERDMAPVLARARLDGDDVVLAWPGHDEFTRVVRRQP